MSDSVIPGGGADPMRVKGEVNNAETPSADEIDAQRLASMKERLDKMLESSPVFKQFRSQILIDITNEGLRLQIVDSDNASHVRPGQRQGGAAHARHPARDRPDAQRPAQQDHAVGPHRRHNYTNGDRAYGNWELSADRANASRRELMTGSMADGKVMRVIGVADTMHLDKADPRNPINRRISVILLNHRTQAQIERENAGSANSLDLKKAPPTAAPASSLPANVKTVALQPASPTK
jgi:chemotaxis protein MotB